MNQPNKQNKLFSLGAGLLFFACLLWGYGNYVSAARNTNIQLFNFKETFSWRDDNGDIYRADSRENVDTMLLSSHSWKDFELSFDIIHARDAGVIYNYQGSENFSFMFFSEMNKSIFWGLYKDGRRAILNVSELTYEPHMPCVLKVTGKEVSLSVNGKPIAQIENAGDGGQMGFLLLEATEPLTVFRGVAVAGHTEQGYIATAEKGSQERRIMIYWGSLFLFYGLILSFGYYLAGWLKCSRGVEARCVPSARAKKDFINFWIAAAVHLAITVFIFWPFVSRGGVLVSSSDNYGEIFPLFFLSKHNLASILSGESLCLWNPYTHNGVPFFSNHWNMIYYPLNWPIFFVNDAVVMSAITLRTFVEVFLLGVLAYGFFARELRSRSWALFCSVVYQLCSLLIFTFTVFPSISLYFSMTLYLYVLWSMPERKMVWNYVLLVVAAVLILTSANVAFIFYGSLSLMAFTVYRLISMEEGIKEKLQAMKLLVLSVATGLLISSIRIIPCILGVLDSNRIVDNYYTLHDRFALITRLFLPEIAGWYGRNAFNALTSKNLNLIFERSDLPSNSQNAFFVYFGVIAAMLLLLNVFIKARGRHAFWKTYSFVVILAALLFQPFWGALCIIFFPLNHYSYHIIILPVGVCALLGYTGLLIERRGFSIRGSAAAYAGGLFLVQSCLVVIFTYLFPPVTSFTRIILFAMLLWYGAYFFISRYQHRWEQQFLLITTIFLDLLSWVAFFFAATAVLIKPSPAKDALVPTLIVPTFLVYLVVLSTLRSYAFFFQGKLSGPAKKVFYLAAVLVPLIAGAGITSPVFSEFLNVPDAYRNYFIDIALGETKFLLLGAITVALVIFYKVRWIPRRVLVGLFIILAVCDLAAFNVRFDNVVATVWNRAFYPIAFPYLDYSQKLRGELDLVNFRANAINRAGLNSNKNLIFKMPSYTGIIGYMPKRFSTFVKSFGYPKDTILIHPEDSIFDDRFLDLSAVKYNFNEDGQPIVRDSALSRLMLYHNYDVVHDERDLLSVLQNPTFDPHNSVLLSQELESVVSGGASGRKAQPVPIEKATGDQVSARVNDPAPGLVLFVESYDKGWKAYVDGKRVNVQPANYNFMAAPVPAGEHEIRFSYEPETYFMSRKMTLAGLALFAAAFLWLFASEKKRSGRPA